MKPDFSKYADGLVPVIIQDVTTQTVLMLGFMNEEAFTKTQSENKVTFFSRSKQRLIRGFKAMRSAPDAFGQLVALGLTVLIIAQAFFNISVALSLVPAKGIPLPFISAGGSSLAISLFASGVLLNISKHEGS